KKDGGDGCAALVEPTGQARSSPSKKLKRSPKPPFSPRGAAKRSDEGAAASPPPRARNLTIPCRPPHHDETCSHVLPAIITPCTGAGNPPSSRDMKTADADILIIPGLGHAGPGHWQHRWASRIRNARFVEQEEWHEPALDDWVSAIERDIMMATRPVVLVGHSLGVSAIVAASARLTDTKVRGAFLVAPPDVD